MLQLAVAKTTSLDNGKIIAALHKGSWPTVEGVLRWNSIGEPQGKDLLVEWVNGKLLPGLPDEDRAARAGRTEAGLGRQGEGRLAGS